MTPEEFEHIVPCLRPLMVRVGRDFFGNRDDAEDVAQESLACLWTYCSRLDAGRNMEALAIRVAKNVSVDIYKRRQVVTLPIKAQMDVAVVESADSNVDFEETQNRLALAMAKLSPREQQLMQASKMDGLSNDEISKQTGIAKASLQSILSMAKKKLLKQFNQLDNEIR